MRDTCNRRNEKNNWCQFGIYFLESSQEEKQEYRIHQNMEQSNMKKASKYQSINLTFLDQIAYCSSEIDKHIS